MRPDARPAPRHARARLWFPRQHGAWAMLAVPLLLGVAATSASAWHLPLAVAAVAGYLAAATAQAWLRARRRPDFVPSLAVYGGLFAVAGLVLVAAFPALLLSAVVVVPAGALVVGGARPGTPRDLVNSLAQTAIALVLVPAAGHVSGAWDATAIVVATAVAAGYLVGTVLVVRSVIRERGNRAFAGLSVGFHARLHARGRRHASPGRTRCTSSASRAGRSPFRWWSDGRPAARARCGRSMSASSRSSRRRCS